MNLTATAIRRPSLIIVLFAVLTFMGVASYFSLPIELVPKFSAPVVTIITIYPGASPSEVENAVSKPIEDAISSVEGIDQIQIGSNENTSFIAVEFEQQIDLDKAVQELERKINPIKAVFPKEVRPPVINKFALDELPVLRLAVFGNSQGTDFSDLVKNRLVPDIAQVAGVAQVAVLGSEDREIRVNISSQKLEQYGLSLLQVAQAVNLSNLDFPTGKVTDDDGQTRIRFAGKFESLDEIRRLVIGKSKFGASVFLQDVAEVQDGTRDAEVICRTNGLPAIGLSIRKQSDANAVEMSEGVLKKLAALEKTYAGESVQFEVVANSSIYTKKATDAVIHDLALAVLLVALVMLLFLHSLRNALIVLVSIPTSIVSTFVMMKIFGYSLNLMSLLGLSLAIGILVDDAIVVIENIYRHLEMGKNRVQASYDGRMEIGYTAISITLVDVVVFLPIVFTIGLVPNLLRQFCMTVVTSTMMSLLVSFTLVPWLTSRVGKLHRFEGKNLWGKIILHFERLLDWISEGFVTALRWALSNFLTKTLTVVGAVGLFLASFLLVTRGYIGNAFFDPGDRGEFLLSIELPKNSSLAQTNELTKKVEKWLAEKPEVVKTFTTVGTNNRSFGLTAGFVSEIHVFLIDEKQGRTVPTNVLARQWKIELEENLPGAKFQASPIDIMGLSFSPIEIMLNGPNLDSLLAAVPKITAQMATVPGCVEIQPSVEGGNPEISIVTDRQKLSDFGLTMAQVGLTLQTAFAGNSEAKFRAGGYEYPIRVSLDAFDRRSVSDIQNLSLVHPLGGTVNLKQFADVQETTAPTRLERRDRLPSVMILAQVIGRPNGSVSRDIKAKLDSLPLPTDTYIKYGGDLKRQNQGIGTMGFALWTSLVLVYLIMVALYDNWVYPFTVLFSIPLSLIGAFLALALAKENLTVFTGLGLLMLIGLVGKNAILVVDFANQLRDEGMDLKNALLRATKLRFRPVLMTNIAMVIGLLPIALATGAGSHWKNGLAWAIIGGLNSSMFLSLIVIPVVFWGFDSLVRGLGFGKKSKIEFEE